MLSPKEISSIEDIGTLDGAPVRMIRTVGGLHVVAGKPKGKQKDEALAAASHPAIARYNVLKQFGNRFQPSLQKSEGQPEPIVHDHTKFLSKANADKGFKLYTVNDGLKIECIVTNKNDEVCVQTGLAKAESLEIQEDLRISDLVKSKELKNPGLSLLKAFAAEADFMKKEFIQLEAKKISAEKIRKV